MVDQINIFSVKDITNYIKNLVANDQILSDFWIRGEISNFTHHTSGHMYFTIKDETSKLRAIMFAGNNRFLRFIPKNGMKIIARGYISIYERDGQYQFYAQELQPDGIGQLYLAYEQLKETLEKEGLFDQQHKRNLPSYPNTIGVVTSTTGAAIRDILTTLKRRYPIANILIYPVLVQGESAANSIASGIEQLNNYGDVDLLIVGRGGGSIEELWAFNEEVVARSIFNSRIPIISAVGHETDFTIADFVADVRAATPTAAAEIAVPNINDLKINIAYFEKRLHRQILKQTDYGKYRLTQVMKSVVFKRPKQQLLENVQRVDRLEQRLRFSLVKHKSYHLEQFNAVFQRFLQQNPKQKVEIQKEKLGTLKKQLLRETNAIIQNNSNKLNNKMDKLDALSPLKVMRRGYAIPYDEKEKRLIKSVKDVQLGDILKLRLIDGKLDCQVWSLEENKNE